MRRKRKNNLYILLIILITGLSLGYAFLSQELTINGTGKVTASSWDVYFDSLIPNLNNVSLSQEDVAATIDQTTLTDIDYSVTLQKPGDFYEFTVDVVNDGTMDAMVGLVINNYEDSPISTYNPLPVYLKYSATYSDGMPIEAYHILTGNGGTETYKVRLEYRTDISANDLPATTQTLHFTFGVEYVQADSNAIAVPHPVSFADDSWETVVAAIKSGNTSLYHVGDTKTIELGNDLGTHTLRIANTSTPTECSTTGFSQTACGFVLEFADIITNHRMNLDTYGDSNLDGSTVNGTGNKGGWEYSDMRAYLNSTTYANENINYSTTGIYSSLPEVLRNAIINTTVVSGHGNVDTTNYTTTDKLYLLSTHEVFEDVDGNTSIGIEYYDTAYNNTRQLDYYQAQGVTNSNYSGAIKQYMGSNRNWWLRSVYSISNFAFFYLNTAGNTGNISGNIEYGVSPAFRLG